MTLQESRAGMGEGQGLNMESEEPALHFHGECGPLASLLPPGNQFLLVFYYEEFNI